MAAGLTVRLELRYPPRCQHVILIPVVLWAVAAVYVPVMGAGLNNLQAWVISLIILVFMSLSLFLHSLAHIVASEMGGSHPAKKIFLSPLGDPAQYWPAAFNAGKEALTALAGPLAQGMLAALFYGLWNLQVNTFFSTIVFFLAVFNLGLMALNLTPSFPFDGGRIMRAVIWNMSGLPGMATRLARYVGWGLSAGLIVWGIILIAQQDSFSLLASLASFIIGALTAVSLLIHKGWKWDRPESIMHQSELTKVVRSSIAVLMLLPLAAITISLVPLNEGLEAPDSRLPSSP